MKIRLAAVFLAVMALPFAFASDAAPIYPMLRGLPEFGAVPPGVPWHRAAKKSGNPISQWNGSFVDPTGATVNFTMVGQNPARSHATTNIRVLIVPIRMVYGKQNGKITFDPVKHIVGGTDKSVVDLTVDSPLLKSNVDFVQAGVDLGKTEYIDAYQRGNFWRLIEKNAGYHVLLNPVSVARTQTIKVAPADGSAQRQADGVPFGEMQWDAFDAAVQPFLTALKTTPDMLPIFISYNIYLLDGSLCCVGGYHSAVSSGHTSQTYAYATFFDDPGQFAEDVSALSHEVAEWMDDPFYDNDVNCSSLGKMEVGDPLSGQTFPVEAGGYTYHLQSLAFVTYFGAPRKTSVNRWFSINNDLHAACGF